MHVTKTNVSDTTVKLVISATTEDLAPTKQEVLKKLADQVKLPGFRDGKAPLQLVEKNIDPSVLQSEFLDEAMSHLYSRAANQEHIRPVSRPDVSIKKFVPFTALEFEVTTQVIGKIKLAKYQGLKTSITKKAVTTKDISNVLTSLQTRMSEKKEVSRPAQKNDEVTIDFVGANTKGEAISGADGKDYPLVLGSDSFIPGFEDNLVGLKSGQEKSFNLAFPKDYGVSALASKKVTFTVTIKKVQELQKPELDDDFAAKTGPFKTVQELKDDIKKQLNLEAEKEALSLRQNDLITQIVSKSSVALPPTLIDQQVVHELDELRRNLTYRGQTYDEFLKAEGTTEEAYKKDIIRPQAEKQIKTNIILAEIAEREKIDISPEELEIRIQLLKGQYAQDPQMQAELEKPENHQNIASLMQTEKVLEFLAGEE